MSTTERDKRGRRTSLFYVTWREDDDRPEKRERVRVILLLGVTTKVMEASVVRWMMLGILGMGILWMLGMGIPHLLPGRMWMPRGRGGLGALTGVLTLTGGLKGCRYMTLLALEFMDGKQGRAYFIHMKVLLV